MTDDATPAEETLLAHTGFIRGLVRRLVVDDAVADDIVQETFLAALRRPPADRSRLRQWLGAVARRVAFRTRRSGVRRAQRERVAAREERVAATADIVARLEMQGCVVEEVLALEEPYRTTVVHRYFHGLSTRALARRMSVPLKTVQSRLARAMDQLRARLDGRCGGNRHTWIAALAPLADLAMPSAARAATAGVTLKVACVAVVLLGAVATVVLWHGFEDGSDPKAGGRVLHRALAQLPTRPEQQPQRQASVAPAAWSLLLAELHALETEDYPAGQQLAPRITAFLKDHEQARSLALGEIRRLDEGDAWFHAAVLAAAVGQVPDATAARELFGLLPRLSNLKVVEHTVRALGQNRHGVDVPSGTWSMSAGMVTLNAPIVEEDIRGGLLALARKLRASNDPVDRRFLSTVLSVLAHSVDEDERICEFFVELAAGAPGAARGSALNALAIARDPRAVAYLHRSFADATDPQELGQIASGLVRTDPRSVFLVVERLEDEKLSVRAQERLINSFVSLRTRDPVILDRVGRYLMELIHAHDRPRLQAMGLLSVNTMIINQHRAHEFRRAVIALTGNKQASLASRIRAARVLSTWGRQREVTWPILWRLALTADEDLELRARALESWGETATDDTAESMLEQVGQLKMRPEGRQLQAMIEDVEHRLRRRIRGR